MIFVRVINYMFASFVFLCDDNRSVTFDYDFGPTKFILMIFTLILVY